VKRHTDWLKATIQGVPALSRVFITRAPNADGTVETPYVVIHPSEGEDEATRLTGPRLTQHPRFVVHTVGEDADEALWAAEKLKARLIVNGFGVIPEIPGELCSRVRWSSPVPIQMDDDVSPPLALHVAEVGFDTDPA
jgi:hypothetical protein